MKDHANHRSYVGVRKRKWGKWVSEIREPGKKSRIWLGSYEEAEMAAAAYDVAALHLKGPTARFNFPDLVNTFWKPASDRPEDVQLAAQEAAQAMRRNNIQAMRRNNNLHFDDQRVGLSPTEIQAINESPLDSPTTNYAVMMMMDMVHADQDQAAAAGGEQEEQPLYDYNEAAREWDDDAVAYYSIWD